jgi:hypothetical protein
MRKCLAVLAFLFVTFIPATPSFAVFNKDLSDPFGGCDTAECIEASSYDSSSTSTLCSDSSGCPACTLSMDEKSSQCSKVQFANGFCKCSNPQRPETYPDGGHHPVCDLSGSCIYGRR